MSTEDDLLREAANIRAKLAGERDGDQRQQLKERYYEIDRLIGDLKKHATVTPPVSPRTKGNVTPMMCPKCHQWASEYDENKWQCLSCHIKFIYEPPQEPLKPDLYVKQDVTLSDEGMLYRCPQCNTQFSIMSCPKRQCAECGMEVCPDCWFGLRSVALVFTLFKKDNPAYEKICYSCAKKKEDASRRGCLRGCGGCLVVAVLLFVLFVIWSSAAR